MIHEIKCRFCGTKQGEIELPDKQWQDRVPTNTDLGIADTRCSDCEVDHGNYKEMEAIYEQEIGGSNDEFRAMMEKVGWSKPAFDMEIAIIKAAREAAATLPE